MDASTRLIPSRARQLKPRDLSANLSPNRAAVDNLGPVLVTCLANLLDSPITLFLPHPVEFPLSPLFPLDIQTFIHHFI